MNTKLSASRRRHRLGAVLLLVLTTAAGAAHAQGMRLSTLLELARAADPQLAATRAAVAGVRERVNQAQATLRPNVNLSFNSRIQRDGSSNYDGSLRYDARGAALSINQPLFRLANSASVEQAEAAAAQAERQLRLAEQELRLRVARAYFDILLAQDELAAALAQKEALVQQLAQARRAFEVGTVPITDVNETQSRHDLALAQEIAARNEIASRGKALARIIGRPAPTLATLAPEASVALLAEPEQRELLEAAPRDALSVQVARAALQVAEQELARRSAAHQPTIDLVLTTRRDFNTSYGQFGGTDTRQTSIGVELNMPLYQGGGVSAREREARADIERARHELTSAERQASLDAEQAQLGVQSGSALTQALRQALASSETQLRSTTRGQQVGVRTRVDVLNAQQQLFVTRKDLASARYRTLVSALALQAAAGRLGDAELKQLDALLVD
jgi:outer membrane protein